MINPGLHRELSYARELALVRRGEEALSRSGERSTSAAVPARRRPLARIFGGVGRQPGASPTAGAITIRWAFPDDAVTLARLAALDSSPPPAQPVLIADVDGVPWAAVSLADGAAIADPFRLTAGVVALLRARAEQLRAFGDGPDGGRPLSSAARATRRRRPSRSREPARRGSSPAPERPA